MDSLTTTIKAIISATGTKTRDFTNLTLPMNYTKTISLASGTGDGQANEIFDDYRTLAGAATEDLDLAGSLTNAFGTSITFTRIKALYIENTSLVDNLSVGGAASAQMANIFGNVNDIIVIRPGGFLLLAASDATAYAVTATTADLLKIANGAGGSTVYRIVIVGTVA